MAEQMTDSYMNEVNFLCYKHFPLHFYVIGEILFSYNFVSRGGRNIIRPEKIHELFIL